MATSTIKNDMKIRTATISGTTNAQGALSISSVVSADKTVLGVACTNYNNAMCIPWLYGGTTWFVKIVHWGTLSQSEFANVNVSLVVRYTD